MPSRINPPDEAVLEPFGDLWAGYETMLGFVPESSKTMARVPGLLEGYVGLGMAVIGNGLIDQQLTQLIAHMASAGAGCRYCQAHTVAHAEKLGVDAAKLTDLWSFETSPHFDDAERVALRLAFHAGQQPNLVSDADIAACRAHFDDDQITAIVAVCAFFGLLNRWNDTMATTLEPQAAGAATRLLAHAGWDAGKHASDTDANAD
ncbi:MAG: carboxymuconolactone decarboxylase family protein [Actinomycetota bacterium]